MIDLSGSVAPLSQVHTAPTDPGISWRKDADVAVNAPPDDEADPRPEAQWAVSDDGLTWRKDAEPVVAPDGPGWEQHLRSQHPAHVRHSVPQLLLAQHRQPAAGRPADQRLPSGPFLHPLDAHGRRHRAGGRAGGGHVLRSRSHPATGVRTASVRAETEAAAPRRHHPVRGGRRSRRPGPPDGRTIPGSRESGCTRRWQRCTRYRRGWTEAGCA